MKSSTETLIKAMRALANDIQSPDGVANASIREAADRLEELDNTITAMVEVDGVQIKRLRAHNAELQRYNVGLAEENCKLRAERDQLKTKLERLQVAHDDLQIENTRLEQTYGDDYVAIEQERDQLKARVKWLEFQSMLSPGDPAASQKTIAEHDAEVIEREFSTLADNFACFPEREIGGYLASVETRNYGHSRANQLRQQAKEVQS